jgi:3-isopropylmalate/(R)-2-methylmalate dehydratase small subunit
VIAESFAPIFRNNCIRNGLFPISLPQDVIAELIECAVTIDLVTQTVGGHPFDIGAEDKMMLLEGLDAVELTLKHASAISAFYTRDRAVRPWVYL